MYFATPPRLREPGETEVPLRVSAVHRRAFDGTGDAAPRLYRFTSDLASPFGVGVRTDVLDRPHPSYSMMADTMLHDAVAASGGQEPDLVVLAYAIPEIDPRRCVATRLNHLAGGDPFGFAVSDQGTAAPFSALALIGAHLRSGGCRRAMLVVVEQADLPYEAPPGTALPGRDTAVALVFDAAGPARIAALRRRTAVTASEVDEAIAAELAALPAGPAAVTVIGRDPGPAGMLCTAPWWMLADHLRPAAEPHRTVVVDHDASLGYLSLLAIDS